MDDPGYTVRESARAKHLRIAIFPDGRVIATKPKHVSLVVFNTFMRERMVWIQVAKERILKRSGGYAISLPKIRKGSSAYKDTITQARHIAKERLEYFNTFYNFTYGAISIRNQKTRWGSCSGRNNLSFNYRLALLPPELRDYLIVHELCHTKEHNHSARFWALVAHTIPNYLELRKQLKTRYIL